MHDFAERLRSVIAGELPRLQAMSEAAAARSEKPDAWSIKQEMGHLIDSATNNRVRFVKAALEGAYAGPTYDGRGWVELGGYAELPWKDLADTWVRLNEILATLLQRIPRERLEAQCCVGENGATVTLGFLIDDYILHMQHHLDHMLGRDKQTDYPGAALGV